MKMKNTNKEIVITGKMVVKAAMIVVLIATVVIMGFGIYHADSRLIGEASLFACVQCGYWSALELKKKSDEKTAKNEVVA
jgi:uncharacterized membrane protein YiaA